ncbi:MAG: hypothetical protein Q8N19_15685 [Phenylobacterium sp.]|uniref:hypothetical protein n=1 Tax=Phenylobacterium sp. TaxID=1871053 RepID=UPI002733C8C4|nr:hypothetical protein [Phenylobacterium sp.]MDP3118537.1 hypothetical protein [Phenylobacterium sp.]
MWTVPQPVLRVVALVLLACAVGAFALGILGAEPRGGRLPGEALVEGEGAAPVAATEAQALTAEGPAEAPVEPAAETAAAPAAPAETAQADPQVPALQVPDEPAPAARPPAPPAPPAKAPAPKAPATPQNGDAIGDLVDGLSDLPPF